MPYLAMTSPLELGINGVTLSTNFRGGLVAKFFDSPDFSIRVVVLVHGSSLPIKGLSKTGNKRPHRDACVPRLISEPATPMSNDAYAYVHDHGYQFL